MTDDPIPMPVEGDELEITDEKQDDGPVEDGTTGWPGVQQE